MFLRVEEPAGCIGGNLKMVDEYRFVDQDEWGILSDDERRIIDLQNAEVSFQKYVIPETQGMIYSLSNRTQILFVHHDDAGELESLADYFRYEIRHTIDDLKETLEVYCKRFREMAAEIKGKQGCFVGGCYEPFESDILCDSCSANCEYAEDQKNI